MSYCRWSSDDWRCDIYCYAHVGGFYSINVAGSRHSPLPRKLPPYPKADDEAGWSVWMEEHTKQCRELDAADIVPIGLPCDGETYEIEDAQEAANKLKELRAMGYNVPQYAIERLEEESKESK